MIVVCVCSGWSLGGIATAIASPAPTNPPSAPKVDAPPPTPGAAAESDTAKLQAASALVRAQLASEEITRKQLDDALSDFAKRQYNADQMKKSSEGADMVNTSVTGLSPSSDPEWSLLGDATHIDRLLEAHA